MNFVRFRNNYALYTQYKEVIKEYLEQGIVERVTELTTPKDKTVINLPHQPVLRHDSVTTKLRVVFDASDHENEQLSLKECLYSGPNLNPNLLDLLVQFRLNKDAFIADVGRAFLQISLTDKNRDIVRFLWTDEVSDPDNLNVHIQRLTRVLFGG